MRATEEMRLAWRAAAREIRAASGLGGGLLERRLQIGDGSGRAWRKYMSLKCSPPVPWNWADVLGRAEALGWAGPAAAAMRAAAEAAARALAARPQEEKRRALDRDAAELRVRAARVHTQLRIAQLALAPVPKAVKPWRCAAAADAAATLAEAAARPGAGRGQGGHWPAWLEKLAGDGFDDVGDWLRSVRALQQALRRAGAQDDQALQAALAAEFRRRGMYP